MTTTSSGHDGDRDHDDDSHDGADWTARHAGRPGDDLAGLALLFRRPGRAKRKRRHRQDRTPEVITALVDFANQRKPRHADDIVAAMVKARDRLQEDCKARASAAMAQVVEMIQPLLDVIDDELHLLEALRSRHLLREAMRAVRQRATEK